MKNIFLLSLLSIFTANAQDTKDTQQSSQFQGMAVYESKTSTAEVRSAIGTNKDITPDMQKMIDETMKKMFEKTLILNFDKSASIYKEEEKLETPGQQGGAFRMASSIMGGGGTYYKDVKSKTYTVDKDFMGKEFLVMDSLPKYEWKMESETKQIGGYTCYKATAVVSLSKSDLRNYMPKKTEENAASEKKTNFMEEVDIEKEVIVTAWYTPEIPVNQGPENYWGLPGLILEVSNGKTVILCSKVVINPKQKVNIKAPTKGKQVTQAEYDKIMMEKMEEMGKMGGGAQKQRMEFRQR